jgi:hypothetical protein
MITPHPSTTVTSSLVEVVFRSSIVCNNQNSRAAIFSHADRAFAALTSRRTWTERSRAPNDDSSNGVEGNAGRRYVVALSMACADEWLDWTRVASERATLSITKREL